MKFSYQHRKFFLNLIVFATLAISVLALAALTDSATAAKEQGTETQGSLQVLDSNGKVKAKCSLKHTNVSAEISGFLYRVNVTKEFENPSNEKIEAVYVFPLPQNAAVDKQLSTI
jgi:Ca-activated chloride channel family protein